MYFRLEHVESIFGGRNSFFGWTVNLQQFGTHQKPGHNARSSSRFCGNGKYFCWLFGCVWHGPGISKLPVFKITWFLGYISFCWCCFLLERCHVMCKELDKLPVAASCAHGKDEWLRIWTEQIGFVTTQALSISSIVVSFWNSMFFSHFCCVLSSMIWYEMDLPPNH